MTHDERHARWLEEILEGARPSSDPAALELSSCPTCGPELALLTELSGALDRAGAEERGHLDEAASPASSVLETQVAPTLHGLAARDRRKAPPRWLLALAALVVVTLTLYVVRDGEEQPDGRPIEVLGGSDPSATIRPLGMVGAVEAFGALTWEGELPRAGSWRVRVWSDVEGEEDRLLVDGSDLIEPRFEAVDPDWPARIRWQVTAYAIDGSRVAESDPIRVQRP